MPGNLSLFRYFVVCRFFFKFNFFKKFCQENQQSVKQFGINFDGSDQAPNYLTGLHVSAEDISR